jgi:hypothetical protein
MSTYIPMPGIALMHYQLYVDTIALVAGLSTESTSSDVTCATWLLSGYQLIPETGPCLRMSTTRGGGVSLLVYYIYFSYVSLNRQPQ